MNRAPQMKRQTDRNTWKNHQERVERNNRKIQQSKQTKNTHN